MSNNSYATLDDVFELFKDSITKSDVIYSKANAKVVSSIINERLRRNMTQKEFAEKLNIKQSLVSRWENGDSNFTLKTLSKIAADLDMDLYINIVPHKEIEYVENKKYTCFQFKCTQTPEKPTTFYHSQSNYKTKKEITKKWKEISVC